ncbi:PAS domain-containing protein [Streptoverticillium reticulum]|uniref:response regulator n=1 Tax=Streptoverticillium reticulum TaxID=1433415 RepID=UPI0039BF7DEB
MSSRPSRGAARLAAILDALPDALLLVNCNGTVVNANHIALETFEVPGTGLVGRGLLDLLPDFDSRRIPGSMRLPQDEGGRTRPTRMIARRTDGTRFPVEVTSTNLEDGRTPYADPQPYTGDELLMIVVRDLTGTLDTEAELARQQRQTEMILRAAAEGVVGVDTAGKVVLVNPSAAQILGYRASDLGGRELHPLIHHSRADGSPFPYDESPIADTLRSGRKHRVRGQVLWAKDGRAVAVDLTTAPVRDGEQLVGAVMTFTDRRPYDALAARHAQLLAVLDDALRGPLGQLRTELGTLADDPAGQLWPEANQILHHLAAGYGRMTALVDNVLAYQQLDTGTAKLERAKAGLDEVVAAGVEGAVELIGPGRAQFAVHAPAIEAEIDAEQFARALAHLVADVAGVDATGKTAAGDSTIVVAAAQRGEVVRIEVRGPHPGGSPVHQPIVRGIVQQHGGVLQKHDRAYVLEVPVSADGTPVTGSELRPDPNASIGSGTTVMPMPAQRARGTAEETAPAAKADAEPAVQPTGRRRGPARPEEETPQPAGAPTGRRARREPVPAEAPRTAFALPPAEADRTAQPAGRRARRAAAPGRQAPEPTAPRTAFALPPAEADRPAKPATPAPRKPADDGFASGEETPAPPAPAPEKPAAAQPGLQGGGTAAFLHEHPAVPVPFPPAAPEKAPQERAAELRDGKPEFTPAAPGDNGERVQGGGTAAFLAEPSATPRNGDPAFPPAVGDSGSHPQGGTAAFLQEPATTAGQRNSAPAFPPAAGDSSNHPRNSAPAFPPATGDSSNHPQGGGTAAFLQEPTATAGQRGSAGNHAQGGGTAAFAPGAAAFPNDPAPAPAPQKPAAGDGAPPFAPVAPGGPGALPQEQPARAAAPEAAAAAASAHTRPEQAVATPDGPARPADAPDRTPPAPEPDAAPRPADSPAESGSSPHPTPGTGRRRARRALAEEPGGSAPQDGPPAPRPISVRTLGQGPGAGETPAGGTAVGSGRRRKLANPADTPREAKAQAAPAPAAPARPHPLPEARAFAVGAPDEGSEGPEPLDGPDGAVEVVEPVRPPMDDELPPEPLDNPRRLLVWPAPDASTESALTERGYRPVIVHSREEVDAQKAAYPAALFIDPLTGPITRTALQSLREAAVAAEVPVLVTAGLGQATREAAYGADPAVLLKALAPRDSEMHPPRVLLIEEQEPVAGALRATLERRGMHVVCAATDAEAVQLARQTHPNLVVMDLMQVRRRRAGIVDWLRGNGLLSHTPLVVYTSADMDPSQLPRLASGETVLFLAERSTSAEVQGRIVDLLAKIGTN